jgi:amino acid adenylation domain-containing protein/non-ribosomal peptide synthase protein (TIGR01720 family)
LSERINEINTLVTSEKYREHAAFWKAAFDRIGGDFRLRQNWQSYALPFGPAPCHTSAIDGEAGRFLDEASKSNALGAFVILLAAIFQVLRVYTGAQTLFVDSPRLITGREPENGDQLPLLAADAAGITVREHLKIVREIVAQSYSYQDFPIGQFVEGFLKRKPLPATNLCVHFESVHQSAAALDGYDLAIAISRAASLEIRLQANPTAFTMHYLQHFSRHLRNVIAGYRDLDRPLDRVALIDAEERCRLTPPAETARVDGTVVDSFAARVKSSPQSIAVKAEDSEITYADLDDWSSRLAYFLRSEYGIDRGDAVGVVSDRSIGWVIALLGILKARAVYLPLDPNYPEDRLRFMIEDANTRALLVHSDYLPLLTELWAIPMVALDFQLGTLEPAAGMPAPQAGDAAYIIYTSGSTGVAKGVVLRHRGLLNMAQHHVDAFGFTTTDRLLQFYSLGFDGSMMEVFSALLSGGRLVLARPEVIRDPALFSSYIRRQAATTINAPPSYLNALDWEPLDTVRRVISAGEPANVGNARQLARTRSYHNSYGPTETSVCVTDYVVDPKVCYGSRIPVGKPIRNVRIYLLDDDLDLVPEGCVGEICVSGIALAQGYLNREDLTVQAFVPNPFEPGERLYRTGDLGIWLPDGNLEIIGRKDMQVKLRGYRIELGEIEAVLMQHEAVDSAVVIIRDDNGTDGRQLVAWIAPARATVAELRQYLKTRLPEFMIPAVFAIVDQMPFTPNDKIDRRSLAALSPATTNKVSWVQPMDAIQRALAKIWCEILRLESVGIHDNFFELGGDSILIIQILSRAQETGIRLTAQQHFEHPTIAALSQLAVDSPSTAAEQGVITGPAPLTPAQHWFFSRRLEDPHHFNQSAMVEVPAELQAGVIERALERIIEHHDTLRLAFFRTANDGWEQLHTPPPLAAPVGVTSLAELTPADQEAAILAEASRLQASFRLSEPPLLRAHLFRLGADKRSLLLLIVHHLIIDGVSWRVLFEDLHAACCRIEANEPVQLPAKTTPLREWAQRVVELGRTEFDGLDYWRETANRARRMQISIPVDGTSPSGPASIGIELDREQTDALLHDTLKAVNARIEEVLLAALLLTIRDWTGQTAALVDLEGHGRDAILANIDVSRTIGWLTVLYPVLLIDDANGAPGALLRSVKQQLRAVPQNRLGYGFARYPREDPEIAAMPDAPILFNYLGQIDRVLSVSGWKLMLRNNGSERSLRARRTHLLEIEAMVIKSRLRVTWAYDLGILSAARIERGARLYRDNLLLLIAASASPETEGLTPSDFPAARIDQRTLDVLIARVKS